MSESGQVTRVHINDLSPQWLADTKGHSMNHQPSMDSLKAHEIPGRVTIFSGKGGLPAVKVLTDAAEAEIYLHGAQVISYQPKGEEDLLFLSEKSHFVNGTAIRGGVPLVFPWFGGREGLPAHGTARNTEWILTETLELPDGSIRISFHLPDSEPLAADFHVIVGSTLVMELTVSNQGETDATFESCLHTYFQVGDVRNIGISGLQGTPYCNTVCDAEQTDTQPEIRISEETDRLYQNNEATAEILDPSLNRRIRIDKSGSRSTVVWNPWIEKSQRMADFGDEEYLRMICVESGNVKSDAITLAPGERSLLKVEIQSHPLR